MHAYEGEPGESAERTAKRRLGESHAPLERHACQALAVIVEPRRNAPVVSAAGIDRLVDTALGHRTRRGG